jgi:hypothetical protein
MDKMIKIFNYIPELDAFDVTPEYKEIADTLGLSEWNPVVWIGRLFTMDNDYGEHWFDNWTERDAIETKARKLGYDENLLYVIDPTRFKDNVDGACHSNQERALFWTDVLKNLALDFDTLVVFATKCNYPSRYPDGSKNPDHIINFKKKVEELRKKYDTF